MAGFNVGALPYFIQAQGQLQEQERARQLQQQQLMTFQQAQQDRQRQQAAQAAAGNALPQLFAGGQPAAVPQGQMPPPPQPPAPGQGSQPMQQAGGGVPLPQGPAPGQVRPPLPPGGPQGQMPQAGIPPFRPMPTTPPQSAAPQGAIPAPPQPAPMQQQPAQGGPLTIQSAIKVLQDQGLSGADLMAGLGQLTPLLDAQSKQQANELQQQFQRELQIAQLQERYDTLKQHSEDTRASIEERAQAAAASNDIRLQLGQLMAATRGAAQAGKGWQVMTDPQTNKLVRINAETGEVKPFGGETTGLTKPAPGGGHATESERKAGMNYTTMQNAEDVMEQLDRKGVTNLSNLATYQVDNNGHIGAITKAGIRRALTPDEQVLFQAAQQFAEGAGHLKSGARITPDTLNIMTSLYIPQAGDSPELVARKKAARLNDLQAGKLSAGRSLPQGGAPSAGSETTKTIGDKTYVQRNGKWYEQ